MANTQGNSPKRGNAGAATPARHEAKLSRGSTSVDRGGGTVNVAAPAESLEDLADDQAIEAEQAQAELEQKGRRIDWLNLTPTAYVLERVLGEVKGSNGETEPRHHEYRPTARLIALAIAKRMNPQGEAWMSQEDLATRTGLSPKTVWRVGQAEVWDGPLPLFERTWRTTKNGRCGSFKLIRYAERFAEARDEKRKRKRQRVAGMLDGQARGPLSEEDKEAGAELRRQKLELQAELLKRQLSEDEYDCKVRELERPHLRTCGKRAD